MPSQDLVWRYVVRKTSKSEYAQSGTVQHKTESNYQVRSIQQYVFYMVMGSGITKTEHTEAVLMSLPMVYIISPNCIPYCTTLTDYGWRRENGVLQMDWEVQANIDKVS